MNAAVFVDFENLFLSLKNRPELTGQRVRELCVSILENLKAKLRAQGSPMVLGRSYAAFDTYPGSDAAHDLALMGFDPQYVLVGHAGKNSADVQLACDVCRVLYRRPEIHAVVIVSGDRDFIPIARQVLEENRELRVVGIPDSTSGDLRMRVGAERFWNALDLIGENLLEAARLVETAKSGPAGASTPPAGAPAAPTAAAAPASGNGNGSGTGNGTGNVAATAPAAAVLRPKAAIVGHIPVTWRAGDGEHSEAMHLDRLAQVVDLILRARTRHGSDEVWLSPFLKGAMSQHFSGLVHPERRALINDLRQRGVIRIEERENQFADHPYSVIVLDDNHPMAVAAHERAKRREESK
jgi:hypothetical protein